MLTPLDNLLNKITMYRLVLYYLTSLLIITLVFSFFRIIPFNTIDILYSTSLITLTCYTANRFFSYLYKSPTNIESKYITAFILSLILTPNLVHTTPLFLITASFLAMASKYILTINKRHIFNPTAIALTITSFTLSLSANWWVSQQPLLPFVLIGGLVVLRKIQRTLLILSFLVSYSIFYSLTNLNQLEFYSYLRSLFVNSTLPFFALVMLTEPLTTPSNKNLRILYGGVVGFLANPNLHIGNFYSSLEYSLVLGNLISFLLNPKKTAILILDKRIKLTKDVYDFFFITDKRLDFIPGQYIELTLSHPKPDSRGNRRYFTIASAPDKNYIQIGTKFYSSPSSFKKTLMDMRVGDKLTTSDISGDFTLPQDTKTKLTFIAGGIGITPFRSMVENLIIKDEKRDIILFYCTQTQDDIVYRDLFDKGSKNGLRTLYIATDKDGLLNSDTIKENISDYKDRIYFISGPHIMVESFKTILKNLGIKDSQIKTDFFPGYI